MMEFTEASINLGLGNMIPADMAAVALVPIMRKWAFFEQRVMSLEIRNLYTLPFETDKDICTDNGLVHADTDEENGIVVPRM